MDDLIKYGRKRLELAAAGDDFFSTGSGRIAARKFDQLVFAELRPDH